MSMLLQKGLGYNATYASLDYPVLDANWTGTVSFYTTYPGIATFIKTLTVAADVFSLNLTVEDILNLAAGVYSVVSTMVNAPLGLEISSLEYATVTDAVISDQPMTLVTMTIGKVDGTPTGTPTSSLINTVNGLVLTSGWKGVRVTASHAVAYNIDTEIIGTETVTTETNAAGYAQLAVIKGSVVTVTCPSFGKSVTVDTTGLDTIDLSTFF